MSHRHLIFNTSKAELINFSQTLFLCAFSLCTWHLHPRRHSPEPLGAILGLPLFHLHCYPTPSVPPASVHGTTTFSEVITESIISSSFSNLISGLILWVVLQNLLLLVFFPPSLIPPMRLSLHFIWTIAVDYWLVLMTQLSPWANANLNTERKKMPKVLFEVWVGGSLTPPYYKKFFRGRRLKLASRYLRHVVLFISLTTSCTYSLAWDSLVLLSLCVLALSATPSIEMIPFCPTLALSSTTHQNPGHTLTSIPNHHCHHHHRHLMFE